MSEPSRSAAPMSIGDAAEILGVDVATVRRCVKRGQLVADDQTPGGHLRFKLETIQAFQLAQQRKASESDTDTEDFAGAPVGRDNKTRRAG